MKKLALVLLSLILLAACGTSTPEEEPVETKVYKVALLVGELGDLSFNDSAARGVRQAAAEFDDVEVEIVEYGVAVDKYESSLLDTADKGYDMIFTSSTLQEYVEAHAAEFPDTVFGVFDTEIDFSKGGLDNVYGIIYKANEASFLGGYLAAKLSETGVISFLGGMDIPVISDFLVGYIQGAQLANPDVKVAITYAGSWSDSAKGKELALTMFNNQNADVIFNVAGGTGIGGIEASVETGKWSLGVDSDQAMIYDAAGKADFANAIVSSVLKNVDYSLYRAISLHREGKLAVGTNETLGIIEGGVGLADNKYFQANVSEEIRAEIKALEEKVTAGEIEVISAYGKTTEEITAIRDAVKP
jgi:basic membrane protein A and related proteins